MTDKIPKLIAVDLDRTLLTSDKRVTEKTAAVLLSKGILQARILEWVVMLSSRGSSQPWD